MYELGLGRGNNGWSSLRKKGRSGYYPTHWAPAIDCNKYVPFYITWKNGEVVVGKGLYVGKDEILSLGDNPLSSIDEVKLEASGAELYYIIEEGKVDVSFHINKTYIFIMIFIKSFSTLLLHPFSFIHVKLII